MKRAKFLPQAETEQSGIASDEVQHKPAESICQHTLGPLQHLGYCCGKVVKLQTGRHPANVLKDPLQSCQQALLVLRWEKLCVTFVGLGKRHRQCMALLFLAFTIVVNALSKVYLPIPSRMCQR